MSLSDISVSQPSWTDENGDKPKHGNVVYFYDHQKQDGNATKKEGRPIFKNVPFIHISTPGDNLVTIERPVRESDKDEYPREWRAYELKQSTAVVGTPLEAWPQMNRLQVQELKALNIHSVEQLVGVSDGHGSKIMGFHDLKKKAQAFLKMAADGAALERATEKEAELKRENEELKQQLETLTVKVEALMRSVSAQALPRKPGRPRKNGPDTAAASSAG